MAYCVAMMMSVGALEEIYDYARFDVRPFLTILYGRKSGSNACKVLFVFKILWTILGIVCISVALLAGAGCGGGAVVQRRFIALLTDIKTDSI